MHRPSSCTLSRRRLWWLLWFALLLPAAQSAAAWHAVSHTGLESRSETGGNRALHLNDCALCLTAAAMSGGALAGQMERVPIVAANFAAPQVSADGVWPTFPARAYLSRAPPFAPY